MYYLCQIKIVVYILEYSCFENRCYVGQSFTFAVMRLSIFIFLCVSFKFAIGQNRTAVSRVSGALGYTAYAGDVPSGLGVDLGVVYGYQFKSNLSLYAGGRKSTFSGGLPQEYSFSANSASIQLGIGYCFYLLDSRKLSIMPRLGVASHWISSEGGFGDTALANKYFRLWGDSYFTPQYENSQLVDAKTSYVGRNIALEPSLSLGYRVSDKIELGGQYTLSVMKTDALDAWSLPVWVNTSDDLHSVTSVFVRYAFVKL